MMTVKVSVGWRIPKDLLEAIKARATAHDLPISKVVEAALRKALDAPSPETRAVESVRPREHP